MRVKLTLALILLAHVVVNAAQNFNFDSSRSIQVRNRVIDSNFINMEVSIEHPVWQHSQLDNNREFAFLAGEEMLSLDGQPQVPVSGALVRLPITGGARIEIISAEYETLSDVEYARFFDEYSELDNLEEMSDSWYPENVVSIGEPSIFHDFRVAAVTTTPVQVNSARREVRVYSNINYTIHFDTEDSSNELESYPTSLSETFLPYYRDLLDWSDSELDDFAVYRGNVIVVVQDNASILNALQPWIEWKRQKGWKLEFLTDSDVAWNRNSIRTELVNRYNNAEVKFDHVVIIGDASGTVSVPPGTFSSPDFYGAGDQGYSTLAGTDDLVDVAVGRISVSGQQQLAVYVNKVLSYEKNPYMTDTDWYKEGLVAAGSASSGISTIFTCEYAKDVMEDIDYNEVYTAYYNDGQGDVNQRIISNLNNGVGFHVYRGIMGSGLEPHQITALQNNYKTPAVIDITCGRGDWGNGTSINEAYMRAGSVSIPRGGIGCISTATSNTHTRFNNALTGGAVEAVMVKRLPTLGFMLVGAKINLWNNLSSYEFNSVSNFNTWTNLMGDPTVWLYTDIPRSLTVTADTEINVGVNGYEVQVNDDDGPVNGAWVTLFRSDENEEVIGHGVTDVDGNVTIEAPFSFSGNAVLTVTAQNAEPFIQNVTISNQDHMLGYSSVVVIDDGSVGTSGNGNGVAEYGETVGLQFNIHNFGTVTETNIEYSIESTDPAVTSISGSGQINTLAVDGDFIANTALVEISEDVLDHWEILIDIHIQNANGNYWDSYNLEAHAPFYTVEPVAYHQVLLPGNTGEINFNVINNGSGDGQAATLQLSSEDDWVNIAANTSDLDAVNSGSSQNTGNFTVAVDENAFRSYKVEANLAVSFEDGRNQDIPVKLILGSPSNGHPVGPDNYGYTAFDNNDSSYDLAQEYDWVEINGSNANLIFNGQRLPIEDSGSNGDMSIVVDLPFDFTYYGQTYNQITVCSNGWLAMGDQEDMALQRNWVIPSPLGPDAMIAPYWDDRTLSSGGIYFYTNENEGRAIIQWDNVFDGTGASACTFQAIIYETRTDNPTGDGEILFQYRTVQHSQGDFSDVAYWTTGIENHSQDDGLQMAFYNDHTNGVSSIAAGRSILFSTKREQDYGTVTGTVTDDDSGLPIEGVHVSSSYLGTSGQTDENGQYSIEVAAGSNCIIFSKNNYETVRNLNVDVVAGQTVTSDASLYPPSFSVSPEEISIILGHDEQLDVNLTVSNIGQENIDYQIFVSSTLSDTGEGSLGHPLVTYDMMEFGLDMPIMGMAYDGEALWLLESTLWDPIGRIHRFTLDGQMDYSGDFDTEALDIQWIDGMLVTFSFDGLRYYEYDNGELELYDQEYFPMDSFMCVQLDNNEEYAYLGNEWMIAKYDSNGNSVDEFVLNKFISSMSYVPDDDTGKPLHYLGISAAQEYQAHIYRISDEGEGDEMMFQLPFRDFWSPPSICVFSDETDLNYTIATTDYDWEGIRLTLRNYMPRYQLATLSENSGTVNAGEENTVTVSFDGTLLPEGTLEGYIVFNHNGFAGTFAVPVTVESQGASVESNSDLPTEWALDNVWPNPFNPSTKVNFSLVENTMVEMILYNVIGQEVQTLINQPMQAGTHTLTIDGSSMASGIYFLKLKAGPLNEVKKLMLVK